MSQRRVLLLLSTVVVALALGGWVRRTALDSGFWADDYMQYAMLEKLYPSERAPWDLFHFVDGSREDHKRIVDYGVDPWWTHPHFQLSLLRPLPSLMRALDHRWFALNALPQHIHSMLWWALLVLVVGTLLFSVSPPLAAASALLFFSIDESQTVPVLWLANRSALMATVFAIGSLVCHLRWRKRPAEFAWRAFGIALWAIALSCGEYAFASLGYLVCAEVTQRPKGLSRLRALWPYIALALGFLAISSALGYGSAHSALYTSPLNAPIEYASKALRGLPVMMAELVLGVPADWWSFGSPWPEELRAALQLDPDTWRQLPSWRTWQLLLGALSVLVTVLLLRWVRRRVVPAHRTALLWLVAGAVLGLLPVMGSFITTRLALPSSIGFAALYGAVISEALTALTPLGNVGSQTAAANSGAPVTRKPITRLAFAGLAVLAGLLVYIHGVRAFDQSQTTTNFYAYISHSRTAWPLSAQLDERKAHGQRMVMIAAADANDAPHIPFVRAAFGRALLRGFRLLSGAPGAHELRRVDDRTLEVRVLDDFGLDTSVAGSLTRTASEGLSPNEKVAVDGMDVTVLQTHHGQPTRVRFRFDVPLEDESLVFVQSTPQGLSPLRLPAVGAALLLPPPTMPDLALLPAR